LPTGESDFSNPLRRSLWSTVRLGGSYVVGKESEPVHVLIDLRGAQSGYYVKKCWVATPEEYDRFQTDLLAWREALRSYYDYFEE